MPLGGGQAKAIFDKALEIHAAFATMTAKIEAMERQFKLLTEANERFVERVEAAQQQLRDRVGRLEAMMDTVYAASMKEAILQMSREHLEKHGRLPDGLFGVIPGGGSAADRGTRKIEESTEK